MIEDSVIELLAVDSQLIAFFSKYKTAPAIFSDDAPEKAIEPYMVIDIHRNNNGVDSIVQEMDLICEIYHKDSTKAQLRAAGERVEFILSQNEIKDDSRYANIRLWLNDGGPDEERDPREGVNTIDFYIRATRKKFIQQLT